MFTGSKWQRAGIGVLFTVSVVICAFMLGAWIGARFLVPPGAALAGGAMVLGYGLVAALAAGIAAIVVAVRVPIGILVGATFPLGLVAAVFAVVSGRAISESRGRSAAYLEEQVRNLPPFVVRLTYADAVARRPFASIEVDSDRGKYTADPGDGSICTGPLPATDQAKVDLLTVLRGVEGLLLREPDPCGGDGAGLGSRLYLHIVEAMPPVTEADLVLSGACLERHDELRALTTTLEEFFRSASPDRSCSAATS